MLFKQADQHNNKQVFDFVQRAITAAIVIAATIYVAAGPGFTREPKNLFAQGVWFLTLIGLAIIAVRLAVATYAEACRFGALFVTELAIALRLRYRPKLRRCLPFVIVVSMLAAILLLGSMIGEQAINQSGPSRGTHQGAMLLEMPTGIHFHAVRFAPYEGTSGAERRCVDSAIHFCFALEQGVEAFLEMSVTERYARHRGSHSIGSTLKRAVNPCKFCS